MIKRVSILKNWLGRWDCSVIQIFTKTCKASEGLFAMLHKNSKPQSNETILSL